MTGLSLSAGVYLRRPGAEYIPDDVGSLPAPLCPSFSQYLDATLAVLSPLTFGAVPDAYSPSTLCAHVSTGSVMAVPDPAPSSPPSVTSSPPALVDYHDIPYTDHPQMPTLFPQASTGQTNGKSGDVPIIT